MTPIIAGERTEDARAAARRDLVVVGRSGKRQRRQARLPRQDRQQLTAQADDARVDERRRTYDAASFSGTLLPRCRSRRSRSRILEDLVRVLPWSKTARHASSIDDGLRSGELLRGDHRLERPMSPAPCSNCRCRFESSTRSPSTRPSRSIPSTTSSIAAAEPRPPTPTITTTPWSLPPLSAEDTRGASYHRQWSIASGRRRLRGARHGRCGLRRDL